MSEQPEHRSRPIDRRRFFAAGGALAAGAALGIVPGLASAAVTRTASPREFRPERERGWRGWNADNAAALNSAIARARVARGEVVLTQGRSYRFDADSLNAQPEYCTGPGVTVRGEAGSLLVTTNRAARRSLLLQSHDRLLSVHLRGPYYADALPWPEDYLGGGVNGSNKTGWLIEGCEIEGFGGYGVLHGGRDWCGVPGHVAIRNNRIHHNGAAGVLLVTGCDDSVIAGNTIHDNAANGIDCNGSRTLISHNECFRNGWGYRHAVDKSGILIWAAHGPTRDNQIVDNRCYENYRSGVWVGGTEDHPVIGTVVERNETTRNRHSGIEIVGHRVRPDHTTGTRVVDNVAHGNAEWGVYTWQNIRDTVVERNRLSGNGRGCITLNHPGVRARNNSC